MSTKSLSFFGNVKAEWKPAAETLWSNLSDFFKPGENLGRNRVVHSTVVQLMRDIVIGEFKDLHEGRWELNSDYEVLRGVIHGNAEICVKGTTANQVWILGWELLKHEVNIDNGFVFKYKPEKINGPTYYVVWLNNMLYIPHIEVAIGYKFQYDEDDLRREDVNRSVMIVPPFKEWPYAGWIKYGDENPYNDRDIERPDSPDSQFIRNIITDMVFQGFIRVTKHSYNEIEMDKITVTTFKDFLGY